MTELIRQAVREWLARRGATQRKKRRATKNDEGQVFPFAVYPDLADLLARQWEHTSAYNRPAIPLGLPSQRAAHQRFLQGLEGRLHGGPCAGPHRA